MSLQPKKLKNKKEVRAGEMKLGSLFDGSGGFPLAAVMCGITPVWASEIEPFPIKVTSKRFPNMRHIGDITKLSGGEIEPVDIITFGSPCQDLSISGKRAGLQGSRSSLFLEAVRIIREMRIKTDGVYPTFIIWENVYGAFSSNNGQDFQTVLEQITQIAEGPCHVPRPPIPWTVAGAVMGRRSAIAWRTFDAQFWGVPQRRRRIYLVADFRGFRAPEILFKRDNLQSDIRAFKATENNAAPNIGRGLSEAITNKEHFIGRGAAETTRFFSRQGFGKYSENNVSSTLMASYSSDVTDLVLTDVLRRLTPLEYCRLQGFPDWWCDGVTGSDSAQYKMWGNGVALPCVLYIMERIAEIGTEAANNRTEP